MTRRHTFALLTALIALPAALPLPAHAAPHAPSRKPVKGCAWHELADAASGLEAWVQRCNFGDRVLDFQLAKGALRLHDGSTVEAVVEVLPLQPGESAEAGMRRVFLQHTDRKLAARCVLEKAAGSTPPPPPGVLRFNFEPDAAYQKELDARHEDGVPDPPCGDWGDAPDGIQYFEAQPASGARSILFVRLGQDEPLFDEATLRLLPPHR